MYKVTTQIPAKIQKLYSAGKEESDPRKKATASVIEVTVIDGPACDIPSLNLSFALK